MKQISRTPAWAGAADRFRLALVAGLLLHVCSDTRAAPSAPEPPPPPRLTTPSPPPLIVPGQPVRVSLRWDLPDPAEPDPDPTAELGEALLRWDAMTRSETEVAWEGDLIPLQPGDLGGVVTCTASLPLLPVDLPHATDFTIPPRFLANLYSPCASRRLTQSVALPPLSVAPLPLAPPGMPPFSGLLGSWSATLTAERTPVPMRTPLCIDLLLEGHGSATLFRAPVLCHPDLDVLEPSVERQPSAALLHVRWTVIPHRVPLEPIRLAFSTLDPPRYTGHHLEFALQILPDPPPQADAPLPPPVLLRFHPLPPAPTPAGGGALAGGISAGLGALAGLLLAGVARYRAGQRSPEGLRRAALRRLRQIPLTCADELPRVHRELRIWLGLSTGATAADIEATIRRTDPELANELRALESCRFSAAPNADTSLRRLAALMRRLSCLAALAGLGHLAPAALPPEDALPLVAAEAFRQRDFAQACTALTLLRQHGHESPELLLNLANACWYTGRRIEALALYERAVRQYPRHQDSRAGLAWLRAHLPAEDPAPPSPWTLPVRDRLRPDEWLFMAGLLIGLGCTAAGLLRCWQRPARHTLGGAAVAAFICLWFALAQWTGTYRVGASARLTQAIPLRAAPSAAAAALTPILPAGTLVTPSDTHADWLRVRTADAEGWVPETRCILVW